MTIDTTKKYLVATIGPASKNTEFMEVLSAHLPNIARLNLSHNTHQEHKSYIDLIRQVSPQTLIMLDLSGPRAQDSSGHSFDKSQPALTTKDLYDLSFGLAEKVDLVAMSYVRRAEDVIDLKKAMRDLGQLVPIISKIEHHEALNNLDEIIAVSSGLMVARGDLGESIGLENVPLATIKIIKLANEHNKPVIVATEILQSMVTEKAPTRAEVADAWYHIRNGATGIMLSAETAIGKNPVDAIKWSKKILNQAIADKNAIIN